MEYTLTEAAHATGLSRPTVFRAIKKGTLSARREEDRSYRIDASELARVFPIVSLKQNNPVQGHDAKRPDMAETLVLPEAGLTLLQLELRMTKDQLARERELRDQEREGMEREREATHDTVTDLRRRLDRAEERVLALTAVPVAQATTAAQPAVASTPAAPRGLLSRLFGWTGP